jgi:hypothetical protein
MNVHIQMYETYCQPYMMRQVFRKVAMKMKVNFNVGACCYKPALSKIRPSAIFGDRNVCYGSIRGKADSVASTVIGEIYKKVEISRKSQFNSVAVTNISINMQTVSIDRNMETTRWWVLIYLHKYMHTTNISGMMELEN